MFELDIEEKEEISFESPLDNCAVNRLMSLDDQELITILPTIQDINDRLLVYFAMKRTGRDNILTNYMKQKLEGLV